VALLDDRCVRVARAGDASRTAESATARLARNDDTLEPLRWNEMMKYHQYIALSRIATR